MAKVDEAFAYLRSQSVGPGGMGYDTGSRNGKAKVGPKAESASRIQNENRNSHRRDRVDSVTIQGAVLDSSRDYDHIEPADGNVTHSGSSHKR